jgi:lipoic acid synthetase
LGKRKPEWLKVRIGSSDEYYETAKTLRDLNLHTVCQEAHCPNSTDCWGRRTATFMILGDICTRSCRFCAVKNARIGKPVDYEEPERLGTAVRRLRIKYAVITSVDRDDLPDGGAEHFAKCVRSIKSLSPGSKVEALIPDFRGDLESLSKIADAQPEVIGHNIETVRRLQGQLRDPRASYETSLNVLQNIKRLKSNIYTKSSLMVGIGESKEDVLAALNDLRARAVDIVTIGQYLQPSRRHHPVVEYVAPEIFEHYKIEAQRLGFKHVFSGPLVRSSYRAEESFCERTN